MNLQALYDLKERLEYAAIAGTGLMQEDFRLRRAVEALAPLSGANPVFGKICAGANGLLTAPEQERGMRLLDVLSLVDAVIYTQGTANVPGEMTPVEPGFGTCVQIPHSCLDPLIQALSGSGTGRVAQIREFWQEHPEYFRDFRVLPHVVGALKDNYAELADLIGQILTAQGEGIAPMLKAGFDPAGKADMVRRVRLVAKLGGERENEWFAAMLPDSKKDVREAIIQSLGLCQDNVQILLDLCRTERGRTREAALRSLAAMNHPGASAYWKEEARKKPDSVFCLAGVRSDITADLAAISFRAVLERVLTDGDGITRNEIIRVTDTVCGNHSTALMEVWLWAAEHMEEFHRIVPGTAVRNCDLSCAELLEETMMETILLNPEPGVLALAKELAERNRKWFLGGQVLADLGRLSPEEHFERYAPLIVADETENQRDDRIQILRGLGKVRWIQEEHCYALYFLRRDHVKGENVPVSRHLPGFDNRWLKLLTEPNIKQDGAVLSVGAVAEKRDLQSWLLGMIRPGDEENGRIIGSWLYGKLRLSGKLQPYASGLLLCGWKNWKGVLAYCAGKESQVMYHRYIALLAEMPISNRERAEELRELDVLVSSGRVSVWNRHWPSDRIQYLIARLEKEENVEII